jgi:hypothetical protein
MELARFYQYITVGMANNPVIHVFPVILVILASRSFQLSGHSSFQVIPGHKNEKIFFFKITPELKKLRTSITMVQDQ